MMPLLVTGLLTLAAMGCLALGMERHFHAWLGRAATPRQRKDLRLAGWLLLAGAIALSIRHWGASIGAVIWLGVLTFAILGVALILAVRAR